MAKPLTMAETAAELGLHYDTFRKTWRQLPGFPQPIVGRKWDADAVAAWKAQRSRARGAQAPKAYAFPSAKPQALRAALEAIRSA